jgi:hypothetical protein
MKPTPFKLVIPALDILILTLFFSSSCSHNRLKTDEKKLVNQILTEEEQLAQQEARRVEREKQLADSIAKLPKGFRFKEQRGIDPEKPPVTINIAGSLNNIAGKQLSDVASEINYIRLEPVPDPDLPRNQKYRFYMMDNHLVASNIYGIHLFTKEGKFVRTIVKNQLTGFFFDEKNNQLTFWNDYTMVGGGTSVWGRGNSLIYTYSNLVSGERYIMEYDCSQDQTVSIGGFNPENKNQITGLGKVLMDLNHGKTIPPKPRKHQGMWSTSPEGMYEQLGIFSPDRNTYLNRMRGRNMWGIFSNRGDTLATFAKLEQIKNYTKQLMRGTDYGFQYESRGNMYFRSDFNDTVFQVVPPNRIVPLYVLNLGPYKVAKQDGVDPDVRLEGKIIPQEWAETKNYIFLTFTKDNYDCQKNRKSKSVKIYHALFSKTSHQLQIVKGDPFDYEAPILVNNLDGGYPVWPLSYQVGAKGEIMLSLKGSDLKAQVKSSGFQKSTAPADKKEMLKQLADSVSDLDDILMIVQ